MSPYALAVSAAASLLVSANALAQPGPLLFDNGPFITAPGAGFDGADNSVTESGTPIALSFNEASASPLRVADDFTLTGGGMRGTRLSSIDFYGTQSQSVNFTTDRQFRALYIALYDQSPALGASPIAGDFTTSRLLSSTWTGAYRVSSGDLLGRSRPIARLHADMSWAPALSDGQHWLVVSALGDPAISNPPNTIIVTPRLTTAVGFQLFNGNWVSTTDYPFRLYGFCPGDFNFSGAVSVQDIFDFLAAYFASDPAADVNGSGAVTVQDIFDFLAAYFSVCP